MIFWSTFRTLLEFVDGCAAFTALAGLFNAPVFPVRSYLLRALLGIGTFLLLGQMLLNIDNAKHLYGYTGDTLLWMWVTFCLLVGWASWVWRAEILGFFYSFSPHPATDIVDRYVATNKGFDVPGIKKAINEVPDNPVLLKIRTGQAAELAEKLEQENELVAEHEKVERLLVELKKARARVEVFEKRRGSGE